MENDLSVKNLVTDCSAQCALTILPEISVKVEGGRTFEER